MNPNSVLTPSRPWAFDRATRPMKTDAEKIERIILDAVCASEAKLTPRGLERTVRKKVSADRRLFRKTVRALVNAGKLSYTYVHGHSFLERFFNRPVRISHRVVLSPPGVFPDPPRGGAVIKIAPGAAFGTGDHPTTRLCLAGLEVALSREKMPMPETAIDVGTGSGVLAIAAVKLGVRTAVGIDVDPCAVYEAQKNVALNRLEARIRIKEMPLEAINDRFDLVIANLRLPSLKGYLRIIAKMTPPSATAVFSGVKVDEMASLFEACRAAGFRPVWREMEKHWGAAVMDKR